MDPLGIAVSAGILIMSVVLHEVAHGYMAFQLGDMTAYLKGRLSLNPIKHIHPVLTILLPAALLWMSGGQFVFGGAKPVPINPMSFRGVSLRKGMMLTAAAGPLTNILIAVVLAVGLTFALTVRAVATGTATASFRTSMAWDVLSFCILMNLVLAFFNLIPVPPLDGSRILAYFLPRELSQKLDLLEQQFGIMLIFGLIIISDLMGFHIIRTVLTPVRYVGAFLLIGAEFTARQAAGLVIGTG